MSPEELIKKFPNLEFEDDGSHLHDICCPQCGLRSEIHVTVSTVVQLFRNGTGDHEDTEYTGDSECSCRGCGKEGLLDDFTFKGLDDLLEPDEEEA